VIHGGGRRHACYLPDRGDDDLHQAREGRGLPRVTRPRLV
jgi:hypothetical protein